jgi:uncharacterized protein YegP (UPF0339 family)
MWTLEIYEDAGGRSRWRLRATNRQVVATSGEAFATRSNAVRAGTNFTAKARSYDFEVYSDKAGAFRWRAKAANGQIVGSAGEAFSSRAKAQSAADNVKKNAGKARRG